MHCCAGLSCGHETTWINDASSGETAAGASLCASCEKPMHGGLLCGRLLFADTFVCHPCFGRLCRSRNRSQNLDKMKEEESAMTTKSDTETLMVSNNHHTTHQLEQRQRQEQLDPLEPQVQQDLHLSSIFQSSLTSVAASIDKNHCKRRFTEWIKSTTTTTWTQMQNSRKRARSLEGQVAIATQQTRNAVASLGTMSGQENHPHHHHVASSPWQLPPPRKKRRTVVSHAHLTQQTRMAQTTKAMSETTGTTSRRTTDFWGCALSFLAAETDYPTTKQTTPRPRSPPQRQWHPSSSRSRGSVFVAQRYIYKQQQQPRTIFSGASCRGPEKLATTGSTKKSPWNKPPLGLFDASWFRGKDKTEQPL